MEPWQEEMPVKTLEKHPERDKKLKQPQRAEAAAGTDQLQEAFPLSHGVLQRSGDHFRDEGERPGYGDPPGQESADAKLQLSNGFRRQSPAEEKDAPTGQDVRPTLGAPGLGRDESPMPPGEERSVLKRSVKEHLQPPGDRKSEESLMGELSEMVQAVVQSSSWWERHGIDDTIIALNFLALPVGFVLLRLDSLFPFLLGIIVLGIAHYTITVKGSHQASHNSLTESKSWAKLWAIFFIEVCSTFTAEQASYNHVKIHHGYTNVIGLGDSSTWKLPFLNRYIYMFIAPIAIPIITPFVAIADKKPKRIYMMSCGVLNLPRNPLLDWSFGHSLISCHVEHHLFPSLSDNMCLKIKPVVSQYLKEKKLPYHKDTYLSRLQLFLCKYEELMVHAPPITELVGIQ
ncbi:hypothetical protein lerEdw1_017780 [Lerista edwardsae]|nr:hypothetical protein lerEdw1_017780 [Lerista edwardsae]